MELRLPRVVAMTSLVLMAPLVLLVFLAGCASTPRVDGSIPVGSASVASASSVDDRNQLAAATWLVTTYLTAVREGDLSGALALTDPELAPAGANTAENVYRFLGTGIIRLQTWEFVGARANADGGQWVFVVCQVLFDDGWHSEIPLTFKTDTHGKLLFVG